MNRFLAIADNRALVRALGIGAGVLLIIGAVFVPKRRAAIAIAGFGILGASAAFLRRQCDSGQRLRPARGMAKARCVPA